jgi:hypothetical protein
MNETITYLKSVYYTDKLEKLLLTLLSNSNILTVICDSYDTKLKDFFKQHNINVVESSDIIERYKVVPSLPICVKRLIVMYLTLLYKSTATNIGLYMSERYYPTSNIFELITNNKTFVATDNYLIKDSKDITDSLNYCYNRDTFLYDFLKTNTVILNNIIFGLRESCLLTLKELIQDLGIITYSSDRNLSVVDASLQKSVYLDKFRYNIIDNKLLK